MRNGPGKARLLTEARNDSVGVCASEASNKCLVLLSCSHGTYSYGQLAHHIIRDFRISRMAVSIDNVFENVLRRIRHIRTSEMIVVGLRRRRVPVWAKRVIPKRKRVRPSAFSSVMIWFAHRHLHLVATRHPLYRRTISSTTALMVFSAADAAPPIHRINEGTKTLDREFFHKSIPVLAVRIPAPKTGTFRTELRKYVHTCRYPGLSSVNCFRMADPC